MAIDGINGNLGTQFTQAAQNAQAQSGVFMGHAVEVKESPESMLADAAEELGFSVDSTKEYGIEERKQRAKATQAELERVQLYEELMHKAGKSRQLDNLVDALRKAGSPDAREALARAKDAFPDPTDAWAALLEAADRLEKEGSSQAAKAARAAAEQLYATDGQAIRLGLHGAVCGRDSELGSPDQMRDLYRSTVGEFSSVNEVFEDIQKNFGADMEKALDFLFSALGADLASDDPTMEKSHLESVTTKLGAVRLTQSAYRLCEAQMDRWQNVHEVRDPSALTSMQLLKAVLDLRGKRFLGAPQIDSIVAQAHAPDIEREVLFTQDLLATVRKFPSALFDGDEGLSNVQSAVQESLDRAVEREDEYLASQEE